MTEIVLLVEPDGASVKLRPRVLQESHIHEIIENCKLGNGHDWTRLWRCTNGERALTGQRIFREVLPAAAPAIETPLYDETVLKEPLRFHEDETPMGWRRKHLRKA